jgi:hypothetical protein
LVTPTGSAVTPADAAKAVELVRKRAVGMATVIASPRVI